MRLLARGSGRAHESAHAVLAGEAGDLQGIEFVEDINDTFYSAREFGIRDLNGYLLYFIQSLNAGAAT